MTEREKEPVMLELRLTQGFKNDLYFKLPIDGRFNGTIDKVFEYIKELMEQTRSHTNPRDKP